jgi:predicted O-methyltransferase YrrM
MHFLPDDIDDYAAMHTQDEPELLKQLNRETWQKVLLPRMLSGAYQGRLLSLISKLVSPKTILEIGTYTGYSALCLAEGMTKDGKLITIDKNEELEPIVSKYFGLSEYANQLEAKIGNAIEIIPTLNEKFDLVFIDADKSNYINYFNMIIDKMNTGGIILSDNVLWSGKVVKPTTEKDIDTKVLKEYNLLLKEDSRLETILLPIRDGLTISRRK